MPDKFRYPSLEGMNWDDEEALERYTLRCELLDKAKQALEDLFNFVSDPVEFEADVRHLVEKAGQGHILRPKVVPTIPLPTVAPALWIDREWPDQSPPDFISEIYRDWLGNGLTRAHVHKLDAPLYNALARWLTVNKKMPPGVDLPTKAEQNTRDLQIAQRQPETLAPSDRARLFHVAKTRQHRQPTPT